MICWRVRRHMFLFPRSVLLFTVSILSLFPSFADDWPQWLGPHRNGVSTETAWNQEWPKGGLETLWTFEAGSGFTPPSIAEGLLVTLGYDNGNDVAYSLPAD